MFELVHLVTSVEDFATRLLANNYHTETRNAKRGGRPVAIITILAVRGGSVPTKADRVVLLAFIFPSWAESHQNYQLIEGGSKVGGDMVFSVYVQPGIQDYFVHTIGSLIMSLEKEATSSKGENKFDLKFFVELHSPRVLLSRQC
jgi:hypothetical protein